MGRTRQQDRWRLDDKLQLAELDQRASHTYRHRFCGVELVVCVCGLADGEFGLVVLGECKGLAYFCCCWRSFPFCLGRSRSVLSFVVLLQCGLLSEFIMITRLPCLAACLAAASLPASFIITILPPVLKRIHFHAHKLTPSPRWLRLAHSLDLQLSLRLCPLQLEDPNNRRPRSLRRLGPWRQRL
jgi:hypothetical protein